MKFKVVGVQRHCKWSYQGSSGVNQRLHLVHVDQLVNAQSDDDNEGRIVEVIKVPLRIDMSNIHAGDFVSVMYNRFGQVEEVSKVDKA